MRGKIEWLNLEWAEEWREAAQRERGGMKRLLESLERGPLRHLSDEIMRSEIRYLREQLDAADKRNAELAAENAVLKDKIEQRDLRIVALESELADYEKSMGNANELIRDLKAENVALEADLEDERERSGIEIDYLEDLCR